MARPVEFEREDVLANAMEQFWREGYEASSVQKLLDVTGINRGTLYNSFGDKDAFFKSCLDKYNGLLKAAIDATLGNAELKGWDAIEAYFGAAVTAVSNKQRNLGCLLVNSVCGSVNYDKEVQKLLKASLNNIRKALLDRSKELEKAGQLKKGVVADTATEVLMNTLNGLRVASRTGKTPKQMEEVVAFTIASLKK
ncbi:MAG: TetR/AcrR family transcriptional regulator [Pseudomonadales bacterium]|nr:TetR/AcrR family transcriptional regulator [Pseudomonadales bacterium]